MLWGLFGSRKHMSKAYLEPGRLEDVLALIQLLGLGDGLNRAENAITKTLRPPQSARSWVELARKHPEFFRVTEKGNLALISRLLSETGEEGAALEADYVRGLIEAAIRIHHGQLQRRQILRATWAVVAFSILPALGSIVVAILTRGK